MRPRKSDGFEVMKINQIVTPIMRFLVRCKVNSLFHAILDGQESFVLSKIIIFTDFSEVQKDIFVRYPDFQLKKSLIHIFNDHNMMHKNKTQACFTYSQSFEVELCYTTLLYPFQSKYSMIKSNILKISGFSCRYVRHPKNL